MLDLNEGSEFAIEVFEHVVALGSFLDHCVASRNTYVVCYTHVAFLASTNADLRLVLCVYYIEHLLGSTVQRLKDYVI